MNRRVSLAAIAGSLTALIGSRAKAQDTGQVVSNRGQIVSTGPVILDQAAGGTQSVAVYDGHGNLVRPAGQAVTNDMQIVSSRGVYATQSAAGQQEVSGSNNNRQTCAPGYVYFNNGRLYYDDDHCNAQEITINCGRC